MTRKEILGNRKVCILLAGELLCLLAVLFSFLRPLSVLSPQLGEAFHLDAGTYTLRLSYTASLEENSFALEDIQSGSQALLFGGAVLSTGDNVEDCELWVLRSTDTAVATLSVAGDAAFTLHEFRITRNHADSRILFFLLLVVSGVVNLLTYVWLYGKRHPIPTEKKWVWAVLSLAWLFSCLPCLADYNLWGDDWGFHLLRVEGLISGLADGQFPVRIQGNWLRGYGYAVSVFYSDLFFVIPMLFRLIGFPVVTSWNLFLAVINGATLLIAWQCFKRCFHNEIAGAAAAVLYTLSAYRLFNLYSRAAMGEVIAMVFLPLVFYGFCQIFTEDCKSPEYSGIWRITALGLTGVIQSHVITCEMLAVCIVILCLVLIRKVLQKERFLELCNAAVMTLLLNLWYLLPFADYMLTGKFNVGHAETMTIKSVHDWAIWPTHALFLFYGGGTRGNISVGMNWTGTYSIGTALLAACLIWMYLEFTGDMRKSRFRWKKTGRLLFLFTLSFLAAATHYFPWDKLQAMGGIVETLILSLQFPYRFLSLACLTAAALAGLILLYVKEKRPSLFRLLTLLFLGISLFFSAYQLNQLMVTHGIARVYNKQSMGSIYVSNGEYLPYEADIALMQPDIVTADDHTGIDSYEKGQYTLRTTVHVANQGADGYVELPLLYYKGYAAKVKETGQYLPVTEGNNSVVRVEIPAGLTGNIVVWFREPWYWRAAELISLLAVLYMAVMWIGKRKHLSETRTGIREESYEMSEA